MTTVIHAAPTVARTSVPTAIPYARLSNFYFWYYGLQGIFHPFWPIFLSSRHFTAGEIGQLLAIQMATRILSPNLWGWVADHTGRRTTTVRVGAALGVAFFSGIFVADGFWATALVMAGYSFFWNAVMPQFEALTLDHLHRQPQRYSIIRVWGSVGFIVTVMGGGYWLDGAVEDFRFLGLGFLTMIWLASLWVPAAPRQPARPRGGDLWRVLSQGRVAAFLLVSCLLQVAHGIYYGFYSLQLEAAGYAPATIGLFWALSVVAEVVLFVAMRGLLTRWNLRQILLVSLGMTVLRWLLIGHFSGWLAVLLLAQCLHALSFGACHAVSVEYLRRFFPRGLLGQGQALYSAASFGAGGALGALLGGLLWREAGALAFDVAALATLAALLVAFFYLKEDGAAEP